MPAMAPGGKGAEAAAVVEGEGDSEDDVDPSAEAVAHVAPVQPAAQLQYSSCVMHDPCTQAGLQVVATALQELPTTTDSPLSLPAAQLAVSLGSRGSCLEFSDGDDVLVFPPKVDPPWPHKAGEGRSKLLPTARLVPARTMTKGARNDVTFCQVNMFTLMSAESVYSLTPGPLIPKFWNDTVL
jgi:hypothetical protein